MTRRQWAHRVGAVAAAVVAVGVAVMVGAPPVTAVRVGLYVVLAVVVESAWHLVGPVASRTGGSPFAAIAWPPRSRPVAPPERLKELQRAMWLAVQSIGGWHFRLRPVLREIADGLMDDRRGVLLDRDADAARAILGPEAWDLLRPGVAMPDDRWADGPPANELESLVRRIEEL